MDNNITRIISTLLDRLKRWSFIVVVFYMAAQPVAHAKDKSLLILSDFKKTYSKTITQDIINNLASSNIRTITSNNINTAINTPVDLIVTIGSRYTKEVLDKNTSKTAMLSLLVPEPGINKFINKNNTHWAALVIDQPLERQLQLIRHALGKRTKVGVILGPSSSAYQQKIRHAAQRTYLIADINTVKSEDNLIPVLKKPSITMTCY